MKDKIIAYQVADKTSDLYSKFYKTYFEASKDLECDISYHWGWDAEILEVEVNKSDLEEIKNMVQINENAYVYKKNRWYYLDTYDLHDVKHTRTIKKEEYDRAIRLKRFIANDGMTVGDRIIQIMHDKGIKQIEMSERTGIAQSCIADWKHKSTSPAANKIMSICEVLECTPEELLKGAK